MNVIIFIRSSLTLVSQTGDRSGELTARMNVSDLQTVLGLSYSTNSSTLSDIRETDHALNGTPTPRSFNKGLILVPRSCNARGGLRTPYVIADPPHVPPRGPDVRLLKNRNLPVEKMQPQGL